MTKSYRAAAIRVSHHYLPHSEMRGSLMTILRAGWLDALPGGSIERTQCPGDDIMYCVSGKGRVTVAGKSFELFPGQLAWMRGDVPHGHRADDADPWSLLWFRLDGPGIGSFRQRFFGDASLSTDIADRREITAWFHGVFEILDSPQDADTDLRLNIEIAEFLRLLSSQRDKIARTGVQAGLNRLREGIAKNPERRWDAGEMEDLAGISGSQLRRLFRKHLNTTPRAYLRRQRLATAQRMMLESSLPIKEIAVACGFCDAYHFSRDFRRVIGCPPKNWRQAEHGR